MTAGKGAEATGGPEGKRGSGGIGNGRPDGGHIKQAWGPGRRGGKDEHQSRPPHEKAEGGGLARLEQCKGHDRGELMPFDRPEFESARLKARKPPRIPPGSLKRRSIPWASPGGHEGANAFKDGPLLVSERSEVTIVGPYRQFPPRPSALRPQGNAFKTDGVSAVGHRGEGGEK